MLFSFPNSVRPKKAAKKIAQALDRPLHGTQEAVARICGYCSWHQLARCQRSTEGFSLDEHLAQPEFLERQVPLILALAGELEVSDGDAQFALAHARLTGNRPPSLSEQIDLRLECWRRTSLPSATGKKRGAVGSFKSAGIAATNAILKSYGQPTFIVTHGNVVAVADFEYVSHQRAKPLFLPFRLYLPYGYWTEFDGARVYFSRDYVPLWRVRAESKPERIEPSSWIDWKDQDFLWPEAATPWTSPRLRHELEAHLTSVGINALPICADALPSLICDDSLKRFDKATKLLGSARAIRKRPS